MKVKIGLYVLTLRVGMTGKTYYRMPDGMIVSRVNSGSREPSVICNGAKLAFRAWFRMKYGIDGPVKSCEVL
jgi:hypothetical protein